MPGAEQGLQEQARTGQGVNRILRGIEKQVSIDRQRLRTNHLTPGQRGGTSASTLRTRREQKSQEDREARLDRQRLRARHLTPGQRWVPLLVVYKVAFLISHNFCP